MGKDLEYQIGAFDGGMSESASHRTPFMAENSTDLPRSKSAARRNARLQADAVAFQSRVAIIEDLAQQGALGDGRSVGRAFRKGRGR